MDAKMFKSMGNAVKVQQRQLQEAEEQLDLIHKGINEVSEVNDEHLNKLDQMIMQADELCEANHINTNDIQQSDIENGLMQLGIGVDEEIEQRDVYQMDTVDTSGDWDDYMRSVEEFARTHSIDLMPDPYMELLSQSQITELKNRVQQDYYAHSPQMDKWDYITAAFCGVAAGIIDSLFVGKPGESKLGQITDKGADELVKKAAQFFYKNDKRTKGRPRKAPDTLVKAISYLEQAFPVPYDARYAKDIVNSMDVPQNMNPANHHLLSLAHSPDIIGLIFSIIDQFSNSAHFIAKGRISKGIPLKTSKAIPYLQGSDLPSKLFCGFVNWIGHIISDLVGSSSTRKPGKTGRGAGVPISFFELFLMCDFGDFDGDTIADTAVKMFEKGYDARFGAAMAIPVVMNDLAVRMIWLLKRHFYHKEPLKKCIPIVLLREIVDNQSNAIVLRRMLLASQGTMCLIDFGDAAIRSGGVKNINFLLRLNFVAWKKFAVNLAISGVMEMRLNYDKNHLNVKKLDKDLQEEWNRLYLAMS